jgi:hypothetical protein
MTHATIADPVGFYSALTTRNAGVITPEAQQRLRTSTVLVAGCGSIGGAAVEPLARLGVQRFLLADPGEYELNNLNRQNATFADIDRNKAAVAADRIRSINPHAEVEVFTDGVTPEVVSYLTRGVDVVVDGVDVTTMSGMRAKYLLHEHACASRLPLFTGWDMAGAQYVRVYDYRRLRTVLDGQLVESDLDTLDSWHLLQRLVPARFVPLEMVQVAGANLENPDFSFPQLVHAADLFGALSAHLVTQLLADEPVREHIYIDLHQAARPTRQRWESRVRRPVEAVRLINRLRRSR